MARDGFHTCLFSGHRLYPQVTHRFPGSATSRAEFEEVESHHTTAQGLRLTCMLKYRYPEWISAHYK